MNAGGGRHWAEIGESTSAGGIRALCWVHRRLGRGAFRACAAPVVLAHWLANARARRASLQYLRRLQAHAGVFAAPPGWRLGLAHFRNFADTLLDKLLAIGGRYPSGRVRLERQPMLEALAARRGGVILTAHLGCLELCQALAEQVPGFRMTALVHTAHAQRFNRILGRLGGGRVELLQVRELGPATATLLAERVARGEFVAVAADRVPLRGGRSVRADFLGRPAPFPVGGYVLAAALRCPLFTMACTRQGEGYAVRFEIFAERVELPRGSRDAALAAYAARFAAWLEAQVRTAPLDWFNFYPFWDPISDDPAIR